MEQPPHADDWYEAEEEAADMNSWTMTQESRPPGLFQPTSAPPPLPEAARRMASGHAYEKVHPGAWKMLRKGMSTAETDSRRTMGVRIGVETMGE